jgi:hypothetical protein
MLLGLPRQTSKIIAVLCIGIAFILGVSCQLHAASHTHARPAGDHQDHHEDSAASALDDISCITAVMPSVGELLSLPFLNYDVSPHVVKPLVPVLELDIPPRSSL